MTLLGIDVGTTHCKAGLFAMDGTALKIAMRPPTAHRTPDGSAYFDPGELWETVAAVIKEALMSRTEPVLAVGISSMAETGLLVDTRRGVARSNLIPWFDTAAQPQATAVANQSDPLERYLKTGLRVSYKCGLAKVLWLRERDPQATDGAVWLSTADYIAYLLTGAAGTDYSLAGRTCAFNITDKSWDADWLDRWDLPADLFPPAHPSGTQVGESRSEWEALGIPAGTPVAVCGHDHVCAAVAVGAVKPGLVFDSMGTAEALVGIFPQRPLTEADYHSGLMIGCHAVRGHNYWMGGLSTSGGAVEWLRAQLGAEPLTYSDFLDLLERASPQPTGVLFFPYLLGSGSVTGDPLARAAVIGLRAYHNRADLAKCILEGTAYEIETVRRAGEQLTLQPIEMLAVAGGGSRNPYWLQIKADVSGCQFAVYPEPEATLLGAALIAGIGCGLYENETEALAASAGRPREIITPDQSRHEVYRTLFEQGYLPLQQPLRHFSTMDIVNPIS